MLSLCAGVDQFSVQEQQTLKWQDEKTFTVASLPLLDVSVCCPSLC